MNVRLVFHRITEQEWLFMVRTRAGHWPMVWHDLRELNETDQRSIYRFVYALGPMGVDSPASIPPWREPATPYVLVIPSTPNADASPR